MLGIERITISHDLLIKLGTIDEVKGMWRGLEAHTTHLKMVADIAVFGKVFDKYFDPLKKERIDGATLCALHTKIVNGTERSHYRTSHDDVEIADLKSEDKAMIGTLDSVAPEDIEPLLEKLLQWIDETLRDKTLHPLIAIGVFSAIFLQIYPFERKNHTILHVLMTVYLLRAGYGYAPYVQLAGLFKWRGEKMFAALKHVQDSVENGAADWSKWLNFMAALFLRQAYNFVQMMNDKKHELFHLPELSQKILKLFETHDRLSMKQIMKLTNGRRSTLKLRLSELLDEGYLMRHGQARSTWYSLV